MVTEVSMPNRRTYNEIYIEGRNRLENNTPVTNFSSTGTVKGLLDVAALEMDQLYNSLEFVSRAIDPTRNFGNDLDKIGFQVGKNRASSVVATDSSTTNFRFYIDPRLNWTVQQLIERNYSSEEIDILEDGGYITTDTNGNVEKLIIPQGIVVSNTNGSVNYTTLNSVEMRGKSDAYVGVVATVAGNDANVQTNVLIKHSLGSVPDLRKISQFIRCSNRFPITNGRYGQSDDEFRYTISIANSALRSNELSIRSAALSVPGVRDILFEKNKYGNGTVSIILDGVSPLISQGLIDAVTQRIQQELSYGDVIFVSAPTYLGVELNFNLVIEPTVTDPLSLRNVARDTIIRYVNDLPIGGEIIWNRFVSEVLDLDGVIDFVPNYFKYGDYDSFNKINKNQVVLRFINQLASFGEKWYTDSGLITCCIAK